MAEAVALTGNKLVRVVDPEIMVKTDLLPR